MPWLRRPRRHARAGPWRPPGRSTTGSRSRARIRHRRACPGPGGKKPRRDWHDRPNLREDTFAIDHPVLEDELAEAAIVAQGRAQAAAADLLPGRRFQLPEAVALHAHPRPDPLGQVVAHRNAGRRVQQLALQVRLAGAVGEVGTGRVLPRQARQQPQDATGTFGELGVEHLPAVGLRIAIGLVPADPGTHLQDLLHRHPLVGGAGQARQVLVHRLVESQQALLHGGAHQGRGDRLDHRERGPARAFVVAQAVALQGDLAILEDQHPANAVAPHEIVDAVFLAADPVARRDGHTRRQRTDLGPLVDNPGRIDLVHVPVGVRLVFRDQFIEIGGTADPRVFHSRVGAGRAACRDEQRQQGRPED